MDKIKAFSESKIDLIMDLNEMIGIEKTIRFIEMYGGIQFRLPMAESVFKNERDSAIYADFEAGFSFRALAVKYSLAAATIRDIVKKGRKLQRTTIESKEKAVSESDNENIAELRRIIGTKSTITLIEKLGGQQLYIPQMSTVLRDERNKCIYAEFNKGKSFKEISQKYSVSEMCIRDVVKKEMSKNK